jgi:hypothetical protein
MPISTQKSSVADPDPGSGVFLNLWIRDGKKILIRDPDPG